MDPHIPAYTLGVRHIVNRTNSCTKNTIPRYFTNPRIPPTKQRKEDPHKVDNENNNNNIGI